MHPYLSQALAAEGRRRLAAEAARERLVRQAASGRPVLAVRAVERTRTAWARLIGARGAACCVPTSAAC